MIFTARTDIETMAAMAGKLDSRGTLRGSCTLCACDAYDGGSAGKRCDDCGHPPGKHQNLSRVSSISGDPQRKKSDFSPCSLPNCTEEAYFDLNTNTQETLCQKHLQFAQVMNLTQSFSPGRSIFSDGLDDDADEYTGSGSGIILHTSTSSQLPLEGASSMKLSQSQPAFFSHMLPSFTEQCSGHAVEPMASLMLDQESCADNECKLPGCKRPRFVEKDGKEHDFCGKTHANLYKKQQVENIDLTMRCKSPDCPRPKHKMPTGEGHYDYCSITCRDEHQGKKSVPLLTSASVPNFSASVAGYGTCSLPGCTNPKYCDPSNNRVHDYCGRSHAHLAATMGIQSSPVDEISIRPATVQEMTLVTGKFQGKWDLRKGACPNIDYIYIIKNTKLEQRWFAYKQGLQNQAVEEHYHGTKLTCNITMDKKLCNDEDCGICGISNTGLDRRCVRKNIQFQRFGHGFYLAPNSSKCHDYTRGYIAHRAMLLCDVCPGNKYFLTRNDETLKGPPQGYNCVYGNTGGNLNYEEIVLYNPDAIMPRYIIVYQKDGIGQIAS